MICVSCESLERFRTLFSGCSQENPAGRSSINHQSNLSECCRDWKQQGKHLLSAGADSQWIQTRTVQGALQSGDCANGAKDRGRTPRSEAFCFIFRAGIRVRFPTLIKAEMSFKVASFQVARRYTRDCCEKSQSAVLPVAILRRVLVSFGGASWFAVENPFD